MERVPSIHVILLISTYFPLLHRRIQFSDPLKRESRALQIRLAHTCMCAPTTKRLILSLFFLSDGSPLTVIHLPSFFHSVSFLSFPLFPSYSDMNPLQFSVVWALTLAQLCVFSQACPTGCRCYSLTVECGSIGLKEIPQGIAHGTQVSGCWLTLFLDLVHVC